MIDRFSKVDSNLYRGSEPDAKDLQILRDQFGVRKIVSLDGSIGQKIHPICKDLGLEHIIFPLTDGNGPNVSRLPNEVKQWQFGGPTFVHCHHGKDRTSMACAMYRILVNNWTPEQALLEAKSFGMGQGFAFGNTYYEAVKNCCPDKNSSDDIVSLQRETLETKQPPPRGDLSSSTYVDNQTALQQQESFAPFTDVEVDHLNRPASLRMKQLIRLAKLIKLSLNKIYKYGPQSMVLQPRQIWTSVPDEAIDMANVKGKLYSALIHSQAKTVEYNSKPIKTYIQAAILNDIDIVIFNHSGRSDYYVINPSVLVDIEEVDGDSNDAPLVGLHDNYTGAAQYSFPGSGGGSMDVGGFGGFVQLPGGNF